MSAAKYHMGLLSLLADSSSCRVSDCRERQSQAAETMLSI
jgi:hypothetical protein